MSYFFFLSRLSRFSTFAKSISSWRSILIQSLMVEKRLVSQSERKVDSLRAYRDVSVFRACREETVITIFMNYHFYTIYTRAVELMTSDNDETYNMQIFANTMLLCKRFKILHFLQTIVNYGYD